MESVFVECMYESLVYVYECITISYLFIIKKQEPKLCSMTPPKHWSIDFIPITIFFLLRTLLLKMEANFIMWVHFIGKT